MPTIYSVEDNTPIAFSDLTGLNVVVTVPAAFSPTCTQACVPGILQQIVALKDAGVQRVIVVSSDQPFALNAWKEAEGWHDPSLEFATDFGSWELRDEVGMLSQEEGKADLPPLLGHLLRRSYMVVKDGEVVWQYVEPDTTQYTLNAEDMLAACQE